MDFTNLASHLQRRGFLPVIHASLQEAAEAILRAIPQGASVGIGGSMSVEESGLYPALLEAGHPVYWHWKTPETSEATRAQALAADVYLTGTNAITEDGILINTDGNGNRVVGQFYGPQTVHFLVGRNKVAADIPAGLRRVREVACPRNARRLGLSTPCAKTGQCHNCHSSQTMCRVTTLLEGPVMGRKVYIHLIDQDIGF